MIESTQTVTYNTQRAGLCLLLLFGSADLVFIIFHLVYKAGFLSEQFDLTRDRGYAELFQYVKEFWCVVLFVLIARQTRTTAYLVWASFFSYLLLDDMLRVHERGGKIIAAYGHFVPFAGLRAKDFGELVVMMAIAGMLLLAVGLAYRYSTSTFRKVSVDMLLLIAGLAFFGVAMDMLHSMIYGIIGSGPVGEILGGTMGLIEDGGEMLAMSLILWYLFMRIARQNSPLFLWQWLRTRYLRRWLK